MELFDLSLGHTTSLYVAEGRRQPKRYFQSMHILGMRMPCDQVGILIIHVFIMDRWS